MPGGDSDPASFLIFNSSFCFVLKKNQGTHPFGNLSVTVIAKIAVLKGYPDDEAFNQIEHGDNGDCLDDHNNV